MEGDNKTETVVVSAKRRFNPFRRTIGGKRSSINKKAVFAVIVVIVLASGGAIAWKILSAEKPVLVVGKTKIFKKDYDELRTQASSRLLNDEAAKSQIIESYTVLAAAEKLGIDIPEAATEIPLGLVTKPYDRDKLGRLLAQGEYVRHYVASRDRDGYEGYAFYYPFSRNFLSSEDKSKDPDFNNPDTIEKDRKQAQSKAQEARKKLEQGQTTPQDIVKAIKADTSLVYGAASNKSGQFRVDTSAYPLETLIPDASRTVGKFFEELKVLKEGGIMPIRDDVQAYTDIQTGQSTTRNTAYYFVIKTKNLKADTEFKAKYEAAVRAVKVVDNVK
ncbi:hypothetical protein EKI60_04290 [Candidatus Saccharibacteria bacterium]|nr:MAG: hypothetical protein EKI60_04290 [Candidatus Saccharibacteria bacterium]